MRRIGEVAAAVGLNPKTLRYYEEIGLLPPPPRTATGYRLYDEEAAERLRFILQARAVGLTLEEISEIMRLRGDGQEPCAHVLALLDRKLMAIRGPTPHPGGGAGRAGGVTPGRARNRAVRRPHLRDHRAPPLRTPGLTDRASSTPERAAETCPASRREAVGRIGRGVWTLSPRP